MYIRVTSRVHLEYISSIIWMYEHVFLIGPHDAHQLSRKYDTSSETTKALRFQLTI